METIYTKLLAVRKLVGSVEKNGTNSFHHYNYATANDVIHEVRGALNENGILIVPKGVTDISFTKDGNVQNYTQHYDVVSQEDGSLIQTSIRCAGEDKGDKGAYKANTGALKYLLLQLFLLPTEDDPENDSKDKKNLEQPRKSNAKPAETDKPWLNEGEAFTKAVEYLKGGGKITDIEKKYKISKPIREKLLSQSI